MGTLKKLLYLKNSNPKVCLKRIGTEPTSNNHIDRNPLLKLPIFDENQCLRSHAWTKDYKQEIEKELQTSISALTHWLLGTLCSRSNPIGKVEPRPSEFITIHCLSCMSFLIIRPDIMFCQDPFKKGNQCTDWIISHWFWINNCAREYRAWNEWIRDKQQQ